jgi:hypothetical protein
VAIDGNRARERPTAKIGLEVNIASPPLLVVVAL